MNKTCIICKKPATFVIKESIEAYCDDCAGDCFSDTSFLQKVEEQAQQLKQLVKERMEEELKD